MPEIMPVIVDDVKKIRTMSDYDVTCKHCAHVYNGRDRINCPSCGNPWRFNDPQGVVR
jgi:rRNA maturation endonuclease Nob1